MAFGGEVPAYYPVCGVYYEFGDGVSTSSDSKWHRLMHDDWVIADQTMISEIDIVEKQQEKMRAVLNRQYNTNKLYSMFRKYLVKGRIMLRFKLVLNPRMTKIT